MVTALLKYLVTMISVGDNTMDFFKFRNALFNNLLNFLVLGSAFVGCDIADLIKEFMGNSQGIAGEIILHFDAPLTTY